VDLTTLGYFWGSEVQDGIKGKDHGYRRCWDVFLGDLLSLYILLYFVIFIFIDCVVVCCILAGPLLSMKLWLSSYMATYRYRGKIDN